MRCMFESSTYGHVVYVLKEPWAAAWDLVGFRRVLRGGVEGRLKLLRGLYVRLGQTYSCHTCCLTQFLGLHTHWIIL